MQVRMQRVADGEKNSTIYNCISNGKFDEAISILTHELQFCQKSRIQSLIGYCQFQKGDYPAAARIYEELANLYPSVSEYRYYNALSLYKAGDFEGALRSAGMVEGTENRQQVTQLLAYIKYEQEEWAQVGALASGWTSDELGASVLQGALLYKQGKIPEALKHFERARNMNSSNCELIYNVALCHFRAKEYDKCMHSIADIIEKGARQRPELVIGRKDEARLLPNSQALKQSALVECFNLKAAIEFNLRQFANARDALQDMPQRKEEDCDPVTLMNQALVFFDQDPSNAFKKLNYLLENPPFPPESFANLLLLYAKLEYFDLAADALAENTDLTFKCISPRDFEFIDSLIFQHASPEEAARKFESLAGRHLDTLRQITQSIKEAQAEKDNDLLQKSLKDYDEALEQYVPVLMAQAKILWNKEEFAQVETLLMDAKDFCSINDTWRLNLAHCFFVQEKYGEALTYYNSIYEKNSMNVLDIPAIVVANLCVTCIMANQNERAEMIIHSLEEAEMKALERNPSQQCLHLCIVNLVIGTLYCSKNNYHFGISRILKSFEPISKKLSTDTWFYAKRCFLSLAEKLAKNFFILEDSILTSILTFLMSCEEYGENVKTRIEPNQSFDPKNSVSYEARILRVLFIKLRE